MCVENVITDHDLRISHRCPHYVHSLLPFSLYLSDLWKGAKKCSFVITMIERMREGEPASQKFLLSLSLSLTFAHFSGR